MCESRVCVIVPMTIVVCVCVWCVCSGAAALSCQEGDDAMDVVGVQVQPPPLLEATVQRHLAPNDPAYVRVVDFRLARVTAEEMATSIFGRIQAGVVYTPDEYVDITFTDGEGLIWLFDEHHDD